MTYSISIEDNATPIINRMVEHLRSRKQLHAAMGYSAKNAIVEHAMEYKDERHETADRLGAPHSNFVGQAIERLSTQVPQSDEEKTTIRMDHPWWARAFGDVEITPSKQYLTIPLIDTAYNKLAPTVNGLFFWRNPKTGKSFLAEAINSPGTKGTLVLWYLLLKLVKQSQERERLPADQEIAAAAVDGATSYLETLIRIEQAKRAKAGTGGEDE